MRMSQTAMLQCVPRHRVGRLVCVIALATAGPTGVRRWRWVQVSVTAKQLSPKGHRYARSLDGAALAMDQ
jgi:hypothetical protein